jgi:integrase/recombinase XerD
MGADQQEALMISLSKAIEGFLIFKSACGRSPYTIRNYRNQLNRLNKWLGNPSLDAVTPAQLLSFFPYLRDEYKVTHLGKLEISPRPLSPKTIKNAWGALSAFWRWASEEFNIENPFKVPPVKANTQPIAPFTKEEVHSLLKVCNQRNGNYRSTLCIRDRAIILTLLDTGIRVSELCEMNVEDVEFETGRIKVTGKGQKSRFVYIGQICGRALWRYIAQRDDKDVSGYSDPVFTSNSGMYRLSRHGVRTILQGIGQRAGVKKVHPHRFRHTFAIEFLRNGGNVFNLQQLLGHTSLDMVRKYVMLAELDLANAHKKASPADNWRLR